MLIAMLRAAGMRFRHTVRRTMFGAFLAFCIGMHRAMLAAVMGFSRLMDIAVLGFGFFGQNSRRHQQNGKQ